MTRHLLAAGVAALLLAGCGGDGKANRAKAAIKTTSEPREAAPPPAPTRADVQAALARFVRLYDRAAEPAFGPRNRAEKLNAAGWLPGSEQAIAVSAACLKAANRSRAVAQSLRALQIPADIPETDQETLQQYLDTKADYYRLNGRWCLMVVKYVDEQKASTVAKARAVEADAIATAEAATKIAKPVFTRHGVPYPEEWA